MGIGPLLIQHILCSLTGILIAALVGVFANWWVGHAEHGRTWVQPLSGTTRSLSTLSLITLFGLVFGVGLSVPIVVFVTLAVLSALTGIMSGVWAVPVTVVNDAQAGGMGELQILGRVEIPLGVSLFVDGPRPASFRVISTVTLVVYTGASRLGRLIFPGLETQGYVMMFSSALLVVALVLALKATLALIQWGATSPDT